MRPGKKLSLIVALSFLILAAEIAAQSTRFTYQGQLINSSVPATGSFDFEILLFDAVSDGTQIGETVSRSGVAVANGIFSLELDFGATFPGANRFLEIRVRQAGGGVYTTLLPRQPLASTPYSIRSLVATTAATATNATTAATAGTFTGNLEGDVTGTQVATTVAKLRGRNIAGTPPSNGQVLKFNTATSQWEPGTDETAIAGGGGGTITGVTAGTGLSGGGASGNVTLSIANNGVGTPQITDNSVTDSKIAGVSGAKVTGAVANATNASTAANATQLGGVVANQYLQIDGSGSGLTNLNASNIASGTIPNTRLGQIPAVNIADGAVTTPKLADGSVTDAKIAGVSGAKITGAVANSTNAVNAANATTATTSASFSGNLTGDVTGSQAATTVGKIQGRNVANTAPNNGQVLKFNTTTSRWEPGNDETATAGPGGTITGVTAGTGLTGGGTSGAVAVSIANSGVNTAQLADASVTDAKIVGVSGAKVTGTVANATNSANATNAETATTATNATQLGGVAAASFLQTNGNGSALSNLNASSISTGTLNNARLGQIPTANIADGAVTAAKIPAAQVVKSVNSIQDNVTLAAGTNISITPSGNTLTIASTAPAVNAILNQSTQQSGANFNISGSGKAVSFDTTNGYSQGGLQILRGLTSETFVGNEAGMAPLSNSGGGNTAIGARSRISETQTVPQVENATAIGFRANATQSNTLILGGVLGQNGATTSTNIGIGTTAPSQRLHVVGNGLFTGNLVVTGSISGTITIPAGSANYIQNTATLQPSSNFNISGNGLIGGNVGIGTTLPEAKLHVNSPSNTQLMIETTGGRKWVLGNMSGNNGNFEIRDHTSGNLSRFTITADGNIGAGTQGPTDKLDVNGTLRVRTLGAGGATALCRNADQQIATCSSSLRYKYNLVPFGLGLDIIKRLNPISFTWKNGGMHDLGLGAEDVAAIEPLLATYNDKGQIEGVKYDRIGVVLVNAVKEQQEQIQRQQEQIEQLLKANQVLSGRLNQLERKSKVAQAAPGPKN